ncbi:MAG: carbohydrate-binding protein, partial [Oscillospiraceae bacterium]|nr:carbohydrate-binding protein [Oscillospiraceae bacterium]
KQGGGDVRGWTIYHENNIWGYALPATSGAFYFPGGGAWMLQHFWEHYAFNMDKEFLEANYRIMLDAALFWVDALWEDSRDGKLVVNPSYSPEHGAYSLGCSADQGIVWELFNNVIKASEVLNKPSSEIGEVKTAMSRLWTPTIGLNGQYQEWKDEVTMDVTGGRGELHRHVNHLYSLHPGTMVSAGRSVQDDEFVRAMKVTLTTRGDGGTGWSKGWKINFWARLRDGDHAGLMVSQIIKESTYKNLWDAHPPFQIDGNFGATAGMTEMLLQSQGGTIDLMAAIPSNWKSGSVTGLKARGNFEVGMEWLENLLESGTVKSLSGERCILRYPGLSRAVVTTQSTGQKVPVTVEDKNTISFPTQAGETYILDDIPVDGKGNNPKSFLDATVNNLYTESIRESTKAPAVIGDNGAYIDDLPATSFAKSVGLKENDIITKSNGYDVTDTSRLLLIYNTIPDGTEVILKVWRENRYIQITLIKGHNEGMTVVPGKIEAEDWDVKIVRMDGGKEKPGNESIAGGTAVNDVSTGDWWLYKNVYFSEPTSSVTFRACKGDGGTAGVQLRIDGTNVSNATTIATASVTGATSWQTYSETTVPVTAGITGVHDVYMYVSSNYLNIDWFSINAANPGAEKPEVPYAGPETGQGDLYLVDKALLAAMVERDESRFTPAVLAGYQKQTVDTYLAALAAAKTILADQTKVYQQPDVNAAVGALRAAVTGLVEIDGPVPPRITAETVPPGSVGTIYSHALTAAGDTPVTWSIDSGSLPDGITLSTAGVLSGTPTAAGTFTFTVKAVNAGGSDEKQFTLVIAGAAEQIKYGDINGDGDLTITDARLLLQHLVGKYAIPEERMVYAQVNNGVTLTVSDARLILQKLVGKIDRFPVEDAFPRKS